MEKVLVTKSGQCEYKGSEHFMNCKGQFKVVQGVNCDNRCRVCNVELTLKDAQDVKK